MLALIIHNYKLNNHLCRLKKYALSVLYPWQYLSHRNLRYTCEQMNEGQVYPVGYQRKERHYGEDMANSDQMVVTAWSLVWRK